MHCRVAALVCPFALVAGCVPAAPPPAREVPAPLPSVPAARPVAARAADWRDWPLSPGTWRYQGASPQQTVASFGSNPANEIVRVICERANPRVLIQATGATAGSSLTIRTTSTTRQLIVAPATPPAIPAAAIAPTDPLLDAMAFSRGRFTVEPVGAAPLVVPAYAEVARVVEDCRG